jgi:hypothetical protein
MKLRPVILGFGLASFAFLRAVGDDSFAFYSQSMLIPERGSVLAYVVQIGTNRFLFLPPPGWKAQYDVGDQSVTLQSRDLAARIVLAIHLAVTPFPEPSAPEPGRRWLHEHHPDLQILAEQPCYTRNLKGWAYDAQQSAAGEVKLRHRWAFVAGESTQITFHLMCAPRAFPEHEFIWGNLLTSFRWEKPPPSRSNP